MKQQAGSFFPRRMQAGYADILLRTIDELEECLALNAGYIAGLNSFVEEAQQYLKREKYAITFLLCLLFA